MSAAPIFPIYQLQDAFEAFCNGEPNVKPQHRSLYYFLIGYCRRRGNTPRFNLVYEAGMHGSGIGSWSTYDSSLKSLEQWGFISYTPGANRFKAPVVELTFRNPTDDVLLTYWQSYCLSTGNSTDDVSTTLVVTLKEQLKEAREKIRKLESGKSAKRLPPASPPVLSEMFSAEVAMLDEAKQARWAKFVAWEKSNPLTAVFSMPKPLLPEQFFTLIETFPDKGAVTSILLEMENWAFLHKKKSAYLTANSWLTRADK